MRLPITTAGGIVGRSKHRRKNRMNSLDDPFSLGNPLSRDRSADHSERVEAIKIWTRQTLALTEESTVSISQFGCAKPTCPRNLTAILVMSQQTPPRKVTIHKSIVDVGEDDVVEAWAELLHNSPS
jgi:hypothetical protein